MEHSVSYDSHQGGDLKPIYLLALLTVSLTTLTSCSTSKPQLTDQQWCTEVKEKLDEQTVGWPVGNSNLTHEQIEAIIKIFSDYSERGSEDLNFVSKTWVEKFKIISPYIENNDYIGFEEKISENDQKAMQLANISIENICQWRTDETQ